MQYICHILKKYPRIHDGDANTSFTQLTLTRAVWFLAETFQAGRANHDISCLINVTGSTV